MEILLLIVLAVPNGFRVDVVSDEHIAKCVQAAQRFAVRRSVNSSRVNHSCHVQTGINDEVLSRQSVR
jgi:hypothetical protein